LGKTVAFIKLECVDLSILYELIVNLSSVVANAFGVMFDRVLAVLGESGGAFVTAFITQMLGDAGNLGFG
jgi:hypothetical protein